MNNYEWVLENGDKVNRFSGEWVVVIRERIFSHGANLGRMLKDVEKEYPREKPFLIKVPERAIQIV